MPTVLARTIDNNYIYAQRADQDENGNNIALTYATKSEVPSVDQVYSASSSNAQSGVAVASAIAASTPAPYTAGDGIDISNNVVSVSYDSNTLDIQSSGSSTVTESYNSTQFDISYRKYIALSGTVGSAFGGVPGTGIETVTLTIPADVVYFDGTISNPVTLAIGTGTVYPSVLAYLTAGNLSTTYDDKDDRTYVNAQTLTVHVPATDTNYWSNNSQIAQQASQNMTFMCGSGMSGQVANYNTTILENSPITISYQAVASLDLTVKNPLPASALADAGKVLQVNASGNAEWATAASVTVDQTYNAASSNAQSGTAVAGALAGLSIPVIGTVEV